MNPNNQSQVQPQTPGRKLNFILPIKNAATIIIAILVVVLAYPYIQDWFVFEPQTVMAIWVIGFILALITRLNYLSRLFLFDMIIVTGIIGYYSFSEGLLVLLSLLIIQKLAKLL
ncbi:hypothetical protein AUK04_03600 [Candidatus Roizmanbacteria bacterium CG2_30_33_16]|uniref:Uncharacterized protein n=1 Tax=Candidatus Roizmanbacteria bacterium CG2_30_33_16 TaxID=1805340 RepID=A0A1J5HT80_9BACT|nr:MAG: hypothetical protein AUK04_03600 [Candidatus Roizmanbacteria bacterium CG2_30_33_16]